MKSSRLAWIACALIVVYLAVVDGRPQHKTEAAVDETPQQKTEETVDGRPQQKTEETTEVAERAESRLAQLKSEEGRLSGTEEAECLEDQSSDMPSDIDLRSATNRRSRCD